jgi:hypothetical protein
MGIPDSSWEQVGLPERGPTAVPGGCASRFLTFLTGRSFVFNNLTVSFCNFAAASCYFYSNFVMPIAAWQVADGEN